MRLGRWRWCRYESDFSNFILKSGFKSRDLEKCPAPNEALDCERQKVSTRIPFFKDGIWKVISRPHALRDWKLSECSSWHQAGWADTNRFWLALLLTVSITFCWDFNVKSESSYQNNHLLYSKIIYRSLALINQQCLLIRGPWSWFTPGAALISFACWKSSSTSRELSPQTSEGKEICFLVSLRLRRGCIGRSRNVSRFLQN